MFHIKKSEMAIKKYYVSAPKLGYQFDKNAKKYFSWGFDIWLVGERKQQRGYPTRQAAEKAAIDVKERKRNGTLNPTTVSKIPALVELFQKKLDSLDSRREKTRSKRVYKYFLELLPKKIKVTQLKTAHLQMLVENRSKDGVSNQTIQRELVPIISALNSGYLFFPSLEDYRPPRIPRLRIIKSKKERVISNDELDKLLAYFFAPSFRGETAQAPELRRRTGQFLLFCLLTLSRPGEIAALKKTDVDLKQGIVSITGTKTKFTATQIVSRMIITQTMREILIERFEKAKGEYLFTQSGAVTPRMYQKMRDACMANKIKYSRTERDGITFHTARHTGITLLVQSGMDLRTVAKLARHSDQQMTLYYTHANPSLVKKASEILEKKLGRNLLNFSGNFSTSSEKPESYRKI